MPQWKPSKTRGKKFGGIRKQTRAGKLASVINSVAAISKSPQFRLAAGASKQYRSDIKKYRTARRVVPKQKPGKQWFGTSVGVYKGPFKRAKKNVKSDETKYLNNGYGLTVECFGRVDDADCVYVGHSTYDRDNLSRTIANAVVRKLLKKCGFNPDSPDQEIPFYAYNDSDGFRLSFTVIDNSGTIFPFNYDIPNDTNLENLTSNSGFLDAVRARMVAIDAHARGDFDRIALYSSDRNGVSTNWRLAGELNLRTEVLEVWVHSTLTVQNRTKSASGSSETDVVDSQPLKGYLYHMYGGVPKTKRMGLTSIAPQTSLNRIQTPGIILAQAVDMNSTYFKEPPVPSFFSNCGKSSYVNLASGDMKKTVVSSKWRGYFNNILIGKLKNVSPDGLQQVTMYAPGKCQILALEERLNSGSTNLITVSYECERKMGAMLISTKKPTMLSAFTEYQLNNVTP